MTDTLSIRLLGTIEIEADGKPLADLHSRPALALLAYLACAPRPHRREALADLLWEARTTSQALSNLRTVLAGLRRWLGDVIVANRDTVALRPDGRCWIDLVQLQARLVTIPRNAELSPVTAAALLDALALYRGDFLDGFHLPSANRYQEWAILERERLHRLVVERYHQVTAYFLDARNFPAGIEVAQRCVTLDPLDEFGHAQLMCMLAFDGQRRAAVRQYDLCCRLLVSELGIQPAAETVALYESIRGGHAISAIGRRTGSAVAD